MKKSNLILLSLLGFYLLLFIPLLGRAPLFDWG